MTIKKQTIHIHFELKDVKDPVLYRDMFPYSSVPKVVFEDRLIQINMPPDIWLTDTTFRDGQQSRPPYTPKQIAESSFRSSSLRSSPDAVDARRRPNKWPRT